MQNPITLEQQRKVWTIHQSVNGITYYYNRSTKKSQYQMPQCFKITQQDLDHPDWKQYRTAQGKKFYYNALTRKSCWHMPAQVKQWKIKIQDQKRLQRQRNGNQQQQPLSQADQIKRKFMALLKNKLVNVNTKWDACIKLCEDDDRWNPLKTSDKKKYFTQYICQLKKINQLQQKAKTQANKVQFIKMLRQHKNLTSDCKMHKIQYDFITDPRWRILQGIDKQNTFQDYMDQLYIKQKQSSRIQKQRNIQNLKTQLEQNQIKYDMKWQQFKTQFKNYQFYKKLNQLDRIHTFTKYIMDAQQRYQTSQIKQKKMKERKNRTQLRTLLKQKLFSGQINYKTKWRYFIKQYKDISYIINMMDPQYKGSSAHQIFQNFIYIIKKNHKQIKSQIKNYFKKINFKMIQDTSYNQFCQKLNNMDLFYESKQILKQYFYNYFIQKIKLKNVAKQQRQKQKQKQKLLALKKAQKKQKKAIFKIFKQYSENSKSKYGISQHIQQIQQNLKQQNIIISRENIFKYFLIYLRQIDCQDDKKSKQSSHSQKNKSKSKSDSSDKSDKKKKKKEKSKQKQRQFLKKQTIDVIKSITIPNQLRKLNDQIQQQGQIKDDQIIQPQIKKNPQKQKQKQKQSDKMLQHEKKIKKKKKQKLFKKKKSKSQSSDSY